MLFLPPVVPPLSLGRFKKHERREISARCTTPNHRHVGITDSTGRSSSRLGLPWSYDEQSVTIGNGQDDFEAAKQLLRRWAQFQLDWAVVDAATGTTCGWPVVVQAQPIPWVPIWVACPLKIAYDEVNHGRGIVHTQQSPEAPSTSLAHATGGVSERDLNRPKSTVLERGAGGDALVAFGHTCLRGHYLAGEERFEVAMRPQDGDVRYTIKAVSRPAHPAAFVLWPFVRFCQHRFAKDSMAAMQQGAAQERRARLGRSRQDAVNAPEGTQENKVAD